jgi:hypothetical protein
MPPILLILISATRIILEVDANVEFDLTLAAYPPLVFPGYYYPTLASPNNPQGVRVIVGYQRIGNQHSASRIYLSTRGSADFSPSIGLNQLYYAPDGEPLPPAGIDPPGGNWQPYSIFYQPITQIPVSGTGQRLFTLPQDYIFKADQNDEAGTARITLYYRLYGL